jgi:hypothetical protein
LETKQQYEKGRLYQWNGSEFVELEPATDTKVPVSEEAMEAVKAVRKSAHQRIGLRPELSLVASAMLLAAAELSDIDDRVRQYGQRVYGSPAQRMIVPTETEIKPPAMPASQDASQQEQQSAGKPVTAYLD